LTGFYARGSSAVAAQSFLGNKLSFIVVNGIVNNAVLINLEGNWQASYLENCGGYYNQSGATGGKGFYLNGLFSGCTFISPWIDGATSAANDIQIGPNYDIVSAKFATLVGHRHLTLPDNAYFHLVGYGLAPATVTGSTYTLLPGDVYVIANRAGTVTLTLPWPASYTGRVLHIKTLQAQTVVSGSSDVVPLTGGAAGTAILPGTAGEWAELACDGTSWVITATRAAGSAYPGTPPTFSTALSTALNAGQVLDWIWGDVTISSPVTITITSQKSGAGLNMNGSRIICGFNNTAADMLTIQTTAGTANVGFFNITWSNIVLYGISGGSNQCRNGLVLQTQGNGGAMYGMVFNRCSAQYFTNSGILLYGNVFETDFFGAFCVGNGFAGVEMRNPTGTGNGLVSSIQFFGGDFRENLNGLAVTADTSFRVEQLGRYRLQLYRHRPGYSCRRGCQPD
jgi:hypothetical protein